MIKILKEQYMLCICGFGLVYMLYTIIKQILMAIRAKSLQIKSKVKQMNLVIYQVGGLHREVLF